MVDATLNCWKCGSSIEAEPLPLARTAECPSCHADLHVCRLCEFHDTAVAKACCEPVADEVQDKTRANFCGYFQPRPGAFAASDTRVATQSRQVLDAMFGNDGAAGDSAGDGGEANASRRQLDDLFGDSKD